MRDRPSSALQVLLVFLQLGLTSFGGPIAHLGYFRHQLVDRRRWLDDAQFSELVALCQFLPGPASSQVGIAIGLKRAGTLGAVAAWLGFTLPSALLLIGFERHFVVAGEPPQVPWLHGLLLAAVAIVAQAVWTMARQFCRGRARLAIALIAALACVLAGSGRMQLLVLAAAAGVGWLVFPPLPAAAGSDAPSAGAGVDAAALATRARAIAALLMFAVLLIALPLAAAMTGNHTLALADRFFRTGSLVFGGGHVVLPLLQAQVVPPGWISNQSFLAGYAAAQAVPGPLFSFAAYLGAAMAPPPHGWLGALICLVAIFLPSFLLVFGVLPFWATLRQRPAVRSAMQGVNAAVVGVLLSALYNPVISSSIHSASDLIIALAGFVLLLVWKLPSWALLLLCVGCSMAIGAVG